MSGAKQLSLIKNSWTKDKFAFGGSLLNGSHPKTKRHFSAKASMHLVLRSSKATGKNSLLLHDRAIARELDKQSKKQFIRIFAAANAGNHLHLLVKAPSRQHLSNFLRALSGRIAQLMSGKKGFWDARPFSRIVDADFTQVARYIAVNSTEMLGLSRSNVKAMFERIREAIQDGRLPQNPDLIAAGFT